MDRSGNTAIKVIVAMGVLAFLALLASSVGLKKALLPNEAERVSPRHSESPFDAQRAMDHLKELTSRARNFGVIQHEQTRDYLLRTASSFGMPAQFIETRTPDASLNHVVAEHRGRKTGRILLLAHYDSIDGGPDYVGANDGASASAFLLEYANSLERDPFTRSVVFVWLDGVARAEGPSSSTLKELIAKIDADSKSGRIETAIYLESVGDCYLHLARDPTAPTWLSGIVSEAASALSLGDHFGGASKTDNPVTAALKAQGIPAIALVDTALGGTPLEHSKIWHTKADTLDRVCPDSLKAIGDVLYHALPAIDGKLDAMTGPR